MIFAKKKILVWCDDPPEDPVISIFAGCLANHDRAHSPLSLIQMDIFDLSKYASSNKQHKYILCIIDVYTRYVWCYKMKNKDNVNVFDSFKKFITDSNLKKYTPTILMSDHDSTFMSSKFQEILKDNEVIHQPNIR